MKIGNGSLLSFGFLVFAQSVVSAVGHAEMSEQTRRQTCFDVREGKATSITYHNGTRNHTDWERVACFLRVSTDGLPLEALIQ